MLLRSNRINIKINGTKEFNDFLFGIYTGENIIKNYDVLDLSSISLNQQKAEELIYVLSKENIEITTLDLSGNDIHTVPDISKLKCTELKLDGNKISCLPDNKNISDFIEVIHLLKNPIGELQIIAFYYINQTPSTQYGAAIDVGFSEKKISRIVNYYKETPDDSKIEIIKYFVEQEFDKGSNAQSIEQELLRLRSLLKKSDSVTAKGIGKLIKFYIQDKSSNGFAEMAEQYLAQPSSQPLKRTKRISKNDL